MKRILTLAAVCLFVFQLNAQALPQGIAYQAVAVKEGPYSLAGQNAPSIYWSNKDIQVRFTILDKYPSGTSQYSEVHATTTDGFGVFNLIIGQGDVLSGDFTEIAWDLGTAHLQVEIDFDNDGSFKLTSLEKFWSVPYAFITRKSSSTSTDSSLNALNNKFNYLRNRDKDTVIGNEGGVSYASLDSLNQVLLAKLARLESLNALDKDTVIGNELQNLILKGDSLFISEGNVVKINHPVNLDNDSTNELQSITLADDTITLSNGGGRIPLESIKTYINSSSGTSGKNGRIDYDGLTRSSIPTGNFKTDTFNFTDPIDGFNIFWTAGYRSYAASFIAFCALDEHGDTMDITYSKISTNLQITTSTYQQSRPSIDYDWGTKQIVSGFLHSSNPFGNGHITFEANTENKIHKLVIKQSAGGSIGASGNISPQFKLYTIRK